MKYRLITILVLISFAGKYIAAQGEREPADWVDVFIGTSNSRWMLDSVRIKFKEIVDGGSHVLIMGAEPNMEWGNNF